MWANLRSQSVRGAKFKMEIEKKTREFRMSDSVSFTSADQLSEIREFVSKSGYRSAILIQKYPKDYIYYETVIISDEGHCRIGFATADAETNGPVGIDRHGYSFGSKCGYTFHRGERRRYGERYFKNDIVGCLLVPSADRWECAFFVNGDAAASTSVPMEAGTYYPAISVYKGCILSVNLGPYFAFEDKVVTKSGFVEPPTGTDEVSDR